MPGGRKVHRYRKGRRWEYEVRDRLAKHGWTVIRAAASKPVDLIAFKPGRMPLVVECKVGRGVSKELRSIRELFWREHGARYIVALKKAKRAKAGSKKNRIRKGRSLL